jgi:hypothetical protein
MLMMVVVVTAALVAMTIGGDFLALVRTNDRTHVGKSIAAHVLTGKPLTGAIAKQVRRVLSLVTLYA